ncbi:MMPL family transporter [Nocardia sp. NBC_00508]|uniref:MMPL family transporter n=1 Tax=Nocardia sp. NBC_00508 TaxID=2975992 RepID=UPI002E808F8D|nr:MMPL family transporter [Nocardia sp. NBC_00508]WUD64697.1 MMPL family transporter [Nocardia sp. NBC_00508]
MGTMGRLVLRNVRAILVLGFLLVLAGGFAGAVVSERLVPYSNQNKASESARAERAVKEAAGFDINPGIAVLVDLPAAPNAPESQERIRTVADLLSKQAGVRRVTSPLDALAGGFTVSTDQRRAAVVANFAPLPDRDRQDTARAVLAELEDVPWATVGGLDVAQVQINDASTRDLVKAELIAFPILFLLALWFFRGLIAAAMPLVIGAFTISMTMLVLWLLTQVTDVSTFALNLITALGLGLALDYSLLFVNRYREERARTGDIESALSIAIATAGRTVALSALTVSLAASSLLTFSENFLRSMGIAGLVVPLVAALATLTLLPAILIVLGPRIDALSPRWLRRRVESDARPIAAGLWYRMADFAMRRAVLCSAVVIAILLLLGSAGLGTRFVMADERVLPPSYSSSRVVESLRTEFGPALSRSIFVEHRGPAAEATALAERISGLDNVKWVSPVVSVGSETSVLAVAPAAPGLSEESVELVHRIRALEDGDHTLVGGETARFVDQMSSFTARLPYALLVVLITTTFFIFVMTGSVLLPIKSFVINVLTVAASFGVMVLIFQDGRFEGLLGYRSVGALDSTQPILITAMIFGICTDYTVFLLSRIKEAHDGGLSNREAVTSSVERTSRVISAAALMFFVAIASFVVSDVLLLKQVAVGVAFAVLIDATLIRSLLVPALMQLLGDWNWWAPSFLDRVHRTASHWGLREEPSQPVGSHAEPIIDN